MTSRRKFLGGLAGAAWMAGLSREAIAQHAPENLRAVTTPPVNRQAGKGQAIDRAALVRRHNPLLRTLDPLAPLSVGNGEFAFTGDITGMQTFPLEYEKAMPLCTMSQWGWHTTPMPSGLDPKSFRLTQYETHGRSVGYQTSSEGQTELYNWLRQNPHRLHLGRIGLRLLTTERREARAADITDIEQALDLWTGILTSRFKFQSVPVKVTTAVHPALDLLAVTIESDLISAQQLAVILAFPYGSPSMQAADWNQSEKHQTTMARQGRQGVELKRVLDADEYFAAVEWQGQAKLLIESRHSFLLNPPPGKTRLVFVIAFSPRPLRQALPTAAQTFAASASHWQRFWNAGAAVELAESKDKRALELERRVVLSQYLTAIQCAGSLPPQETGLTVNSWYGKFHLEMHWWHGAHFALWNRLPLFEKSLAWYERILPTARERAKQQGYAGARWPKMTAPDGRDSPSPIGPLLIWQQPHPIFYAELCYQARPHKATLERYRQIVFESAEFMSSYAFFDQTKRRYVLGPPVIPAQENHPARETWNPTFELGYWHFGLDVAQRWRQRLGMSRSATWDQVLAGLSPLPVRDGVYLAHENCPQTFTERNRDHPSMLAALGMLPGQKVDRETMRRTLHKALKEWQWDETWGWDYPMTAMTAARLGEPEIAVTALLMTTAKNRYLTNGHNWQRADLPCYLPGNGGLLYAVAMMAGGWPGASAVASHGFPAAWTVRAENFNASSIPQTA